ncbi:MAG: hypothetical protein JNL43_07025 [Flavobacteriales bacterium]|nr:hypothetical protein [Flavobacteriales bacterium]
MRSSAWLSLVLACSAAEAQVSPYTGRPVLPPDSSGHYRLLIGGHFHGESTNASGFPAATILAGIDAMNRTGANALLSTGDLFMEPDRDSARYVTSFFTKLELALFNAPGNHDLEGDAYNHLPVAPQLLHMGRDRILLLDTERDDSSILGDQLQMLAALATDADAGRLGRVFIVSHRPVWAEEDPRYSPLFEGNTRSLAGTNYASEVLPILLRIARNGNVYWISGSMAGKAPASIFFQPQPGGITYIQCAVRDELRDALLVADVSPLAVEWSALSLTGMPMQDVTTYDAEWWASHKGVQETFHWRRIPYLVRKNLGYPAFWYGAATAILLMLLVFILWRRSGGKGKAERNGSATRPTVLRQ